MSDKKDKEKVSFWQTLPGCLSAIAALITAIGGCVVVLHTIGLINIPSSATATPSIIPIASPAISSSPTTTLPATNSTSVSQSFNPHPDSSDYIDAFGVPMRLVATGYFTLGNNNAKDDERPAIDVYLDAYYIDKYEVTNALYRLCADANYCQVPGANYYFDDPNYVNHPVVYIDWAMAKTYCEWRGARLPTEAEWEKAAHGTYFRTYPWGEGIDCDHANYNECVGHTTEIGKYELGKSPYDIYDMAGNAWEWVADWYQENYYYTLGIKALNPQGPTDSSETKYKVIRGGSWYFGADDARTTARGEYDPLTLDIDGSLGFRCVLSANP